MKYISWCMIIVAMAVLGPNLTAAADNAAVLEEIQSLKKRIEELEEKLEEQEALSKRQAAKVEDSIGGKIEEALEERFGTLEIHGGAILYYQDSQTDELGGEKSDSPSGAGFTADLELTWHPALPVVEEGEFYVRIHAGNGTGADRTGGGVKPADMLLANLNPIADDNSDEDDDSGLRLLEAHYTHHFFDEMLSSSMRCSASPPARPSSSGFWTTTPSPTTRASSLSASPS